MERESVQRKGPFTGGVSWGQGKEELRDLKQRQKQQKKSLMMKSSPRKRPGLPLGTSKAHGRQRLEDVPGPLALFLFE